MDAFIERPPISTDEVRERLTSHGVQPTSQRLAIAEWVMNSTLHPSADEVFVGVREVLPSVSQATVYNTLNKLVEHNLIQMIHEKGGRIRFDGNTEPHHHFFDIDSGTLHDLAPDYVDIHINRELAPDLDIQRVRVIIEGRASSLGATK